MEQKMKANKSKWVENLKTRERGDNGLFINNISYSLASQLWGLGWLR